MLRWEEKYFTNYFYSHFKILFSLSPSESSKRIHSIARISSLASIITAKRWDFFSSPLPPPRHFFPRSKGADDIGPRVCKLGAKREKGTKTREGEKKEGKRGQGTRSTIFIFMRLLATVYREKRGWFVTALPRSDQFPKSIEAWSVKVTHGKAKFKGDEPQPRFDISDKGSSSVYFIFIRAFFLPR